MLGIVLINQEQRIQELKCFITFKLFLYLINEKVQLKGKHIAFRLFLYYKGKTRRVRERHESNITANIRWSRGSHHKI